MADKSNTNEGPPPPAPKISFGIKTTKTTILKPPPKPTSTTTREYIKSINDGDIEATVKREKEGARIIPLPTSTKSYRQRLTATSAIKAGIKVETELPSDISHLSIDKRAELEILQDLLKKDDDDTQNLNYVIPKVTQEEEELAGAKEASMDDYDNVPIVGFGMAMLRGMGLKEEDENKAKNDEKFSITDEFKFRPKGMGLGADQTVKPKELKIKPKPGQILTMKKGAFVVILGGNYKDFYGEVSGKIFLFLVKKTEKVIKSIQIARYLEQYL